MNVKETINNLLSNLPNSILKERDFKMSISSFIDDLATFSDQENDILNILFLDIIFNFIKESANVNINIMDFNNEAENINKYIDILKHSQKLLERPEIIQFLEDEKKILKEEFYKTFGDSRSQEVNEFLLDHESLYYLKKATLEKNLSYLNENQYYKGFTSNKSPKFSKYIYEFKNEQELLSAMCDSKEDSFISLNLIREENDDYSTYFAFGIRNGQNIIILSNRNHEDYPGQSKKRRRRDRDFAEKISESYLLPYEILENIVFSDRGEVYFSEKSNSTTLTLKNNAKLLADLQLSSLFYILDLFQYMKLKFFDKKIFLEELSYSTFYTNSDKIEYSNSTSLSLTNYKPLIFKDFTIDDLHYSNKEIANNWDITPTGNNNHIEDMMKSKINMDFVNLKESVCYQNRVDAKCPYISLEDSFKNSFSLKSLNSNILGTPEEIKKSRIWTARYNYACLIEAFNKKHFYENKDKVINEINKLFVKNKEKVTELIFKDEIILNVKELSETFNNDSVIEKQINALCKYSKRNYNPFSLDLNISHNYPLVLEEYKYENNRELTFKISILNMDFLLEVLNLDSVYDLPIELQNWGMLKKYKGNSILDNLDPMEYIVKDYWSKLKFHVIFNLSKSEYNNLRKQRGLKEDKFWLNNIKNKEIICAMEE